MRPEQPDETNGNGGAPLPRAQVLRPRGPAPMTRAVRQRMGSDEAFAERVRQSAIRVVTLKSRRGLLTCAG